MQTFVIEIEDDYRFSTEEIRNCIIEGYNPDNIKTYEKVI